MKDLNWEKQNIKSYCKDIKMWKKKLKINRILREQNLKRHSKIKIQDHRPQITKEV
jgi:hypothetical protein